MSQAMRKPFFFAYAKTKTQISFAVTAKLISAFVFATQIVQSLFFLNPKFQASRYLRWLHSPVCVGPGRKPRRPVFSQRGSYYVAIRNGCRENNKYYIDQITAGLHAPLFPSYMVMKFQLTCLWDLRPSLTQTGLYSHRRWLVEA